MARRCLFVACGPTGPLAAEHRDYGDLITINRALEFFDAVDVAFFGTPGKIVASAGHLGRARAYLPLFPLGGVNAYATDLLDPAKVLSPEPLPDFPREPRGGRTALRRHILAGNILGRSGPALYHLQQLGYREFWLFGHDGGHQRADRLAQGDSRRSYDKSRFCVETVVRLLRVKAAFWPDLPRSRQPRGDKETPHA